MAILMIKGVKFYPVCSVNKDHIFYTAVNRAENREEAYFENNSEHNAYLGFDPSKYTFEELHEAVEYAHKALDIFEKAPRRGSLVYASGKDYQMLKGIIFDYETRVAEKQALRG
jgi:hypothetical protein